MPSQREHLRAQIAEVLQQEPHKRRYGNDLKRAIVDYAFARQDEHATIREIAEELGLSAWLLGAADAMGQHLDELEHLLGRESDAREQG